MDKKMIIIFSFLLVNMIIVAISMWRVFEKANRPGWGVVIPLYNIYLYVKISGKPGWWTVSYILWGIIPVLQIFGIVGLTLALSISLAKRFGKGPLFGVGLVFLSFLFWPVLAFGDASYTDLPAEDELPEQQSQTPKSKEFHPSAQPVYKRFASEQTEMKQPYFKQPAEERYLREQPIIKKPIIEKPFEQTLLNRSEMEPPQQKTQFPTPPYHEQPIIKRPIIERPFDRTFQQRPIRQTSIIERPLMEEPDEKKRIKDKWVQEKKVKKSPKKESKWDRLL